MRDFWSNVPANKVFCSMCLRDNLTDHADCGGLMIAVDLVTAAFRPLQPPSFGQDLEPPLLPLEPLAGIFSSGTVAQTNTHNSDQYVGTY